jgi:hypothetical protein
MYIPKWGSIFFLLSSHVMQTPTFISKLSDGNVIFRLDVGKNQLLRSLQNLNGKIVVVMDNAPFHSVLAEKLPTASWSKFKLQDWLK